MTQLAEVKNVIHEEEVRYRSAVSEATLFRMGQMSNFLANRTHSEKQFFLNGRYNVVATPNLGVDGLAIFQFNAEIIGVWMYNMNKGSAGVTQLDIKWASQSGGPFTTIFSDPPQISYLAPDYSYVGIGGSGVGLQAPVLLKNQFNAGDALRMDLVAAQEGPTVASCGLLIHYRPR